MKSAILIVLLILWAGCARKESVLGHFESGEAITVAKASAVESKKPIEITGKVVEKCPVAGCWFYLEDATGRIKVDTKAAGFVVLEVPLGREVKVSGRLSRDGVNQQIDAAGMVF